MSDETWWAYRDNRSLGESGDAEDGFVCTVGISNVKPTEYTICNEKFFIGGGKIFDTMHVERFREYSGVWVKPGDVLAIRPIRIEIKESENERRDFGGGIGAPDACDIINRQAETIEILRKWIIEDGVDMLSDEREITEDPEFYGPEDVELAVLRIEAVNSRRYTAH